MKTFTIAALLLLASLSARAAAPAKPENLALKAKAQASSEYSDKYAAKFAVDGVIPEGLAHADIGKTWAVKGSEAKNKATFTLEWPAPVTIAEVVYYGRTGWLVEECWKDYELWLDDDAKPAAKGTFEMGTGPQVVTIPPRPVRKLTLKFFSSYGGPNPGASEVQVYAQPTPPGALGKFLKAGWEMPEESPEMAKVVREGGLGFDKLLVVERNELNPSHVYTACCEGFKPGGGLYVLSPPTPEGRLKPLVASPEGEIQDLDLSYDAKEVIFSWRKGPKVGYHVYRMNVDGSGLTQLTDGHCHDYNCCWLPDGGIAFISTRASVFALCFVTPSGVLYRMDRDGANVRRLSANYVNDFTPSVLPDGRILYSRWEYVDKPAIPIQSLWTIHPDGTCLSVYYGNSVLSPASFLEARAIPGSSKILCTMTGHNGPIRGAVGVVDRAWGVNAQKAIHNLSPQVHIDPVDKGSGNNVRGPFENPCPIDGQRFLVSGRGTIFVGDLSGRWAVVKPAGKPMGYYNPVPLRPRTRPPAIPLGPQMDSQSEATVYLLDVYKGLEPYVKRGQVKQLCVVQEVNKPLRTAVMGFGFQRPVISCGATYAVKKVWGYVPVEADGSAYFRVPANVPLYFMALDADGQAVQRMRSFAHFPPGETQGCIGCHEPRNITPPPLGHARGGPELVEGPQVAPAAMRRPPSALQPPEWGVEGFDYSRIVQPVLDRCCAKCHTGVAPPKNVDLAGGKTDWFNVSYDVLTRGYVSWIDTRNGREANILQIEPKFWGSPASKLAKQILAGHPDASGKPRVQMDDVSRRRVFAWIDLNVPYYGTYEMAYPLAEGGRRICPKDLDARLAEVAQRRCASCHAKGLPTRGFVRITEPAMNDFLLAPLAKTAGGRGSCGTAIFASTDDPDYQSLLKLFAPLRPMLASHPRMDMPGAQPEVANRSCE